MVRELSRIAARGWRNWETKRRFLFSLWSAITATLVASEPVPEVVGIMYTGTGEGDSRFDPSRARIFFPPSSRLIIIPLAVSRTDPPPMAIIPSRRYAR